MENLTIQQLEKLINSGQKVLDMIVEFNINPSPEQQQLAKDVEGYKNLVSIKKLEGKVSPAFYQHMLANHKEVYNY